MWEGAAKWSTQLRKGVLGCNRSLSVDGLLRSARIWASRESINPAKMKLCLGCHNPFASSKLYKLFAVFFAFRWWLIWYSWDPICRGVALGISSFARSDMWEYWERRTVPAKQKKTSNNEKIKTQKYTNNKTRKPNHKYTNKTIKT